MQRATSHTELLLHSMFQGEIRNGTLFSNFPASLLACFHRLIQYELEDDMEKQIKRCVFSGALAHPLFLQEQAESLSFPV